ncbi:MAG: hypothetical protein HQK84_12790, partial [Nitrospinae bacterium]|nr:hypothetical protein [Nitrospinota bacterium]
MEFTPKVQEAVNNIVHQRCTQLNDLEHIQEILVTVTEKIKDEVNKVDKPSSSFKELLLAIIYSDCDIEIAKNKALEKISWLKNEKIEVQQTVIDVLYKVFGLNVNEICDTLTYAKLETCLKGYPANKFGVAVYNRFSAKQKWEEKFIPTDYPVVNPEKMFTGTNLESNCTYKALEGEVKYMTMNLNQLREKQTDSTILNKIYYRLIYDQFNEINQFHAEDFFHFLYEKRLKYLNTKKFHLEKEIEILPNNQSDFFDNFSSLHLAELRRFSQLEEKMRGEQVIAKGDNLHGFYVILNGKISEKKNDIVQGIMQPDQKKLEEGNLWESVTGQSGILGKKSPWDVHVASKSATLLFISDAVLVAENSSLTKAILEKLLQTYIKKDAYYSQAIRKAEAESNYLAKKESLERNKIKNVENGLEEAENAIKFYVDICLSTTQRKENLEVLTPAEKEEYQRIETKVNSLDGSKVGSKKLVSPEKIKESLNEADFKLYEKIRK